MTFSPTIPQATDLISNSQADLLTNFGQLNTQYGADHDGFNTGSGNGSGMHDQVTFLANQSAPSLTRNSVTGVSGLYANAVSALSQLFFQNSTQNVQLTNLTVVSTTPSATGFGIKTPWGITLNWGQATVNVVGGVGFPITFQVPFTTSAQAAFATTENNISAPTTVGGLVLGGMTIYRYAGGPSNTVFFLAIGV